ncbi:hypothetical protein [Butyrivibrio sp. AE3004]|uniref:hypothetical protein n=1 Tax=Butyrivibrio sp. AE3004 TaxID=1506994 RepID=UPI00049409D8|nr:hypothetical protein [Butyrivibrio sp. AE3004]
MGKRHDYASRNIELLEENIKLLKALKKGSEIAQLIKDLAVAEERGLKLAEDELSIFGEVGDLFQSSKDLTESIKDMADILVENYKISWEREYEREVAYPYVDPKEEL